MNFSKSSFYHPFIGLSILLGGSVGTAIAAPGTLPDSPLFTRNSAAANVFFEVDDSGSMDWDIMTKRHWDVRAYDSGDDALGGEVTDGLYVGPTDNDGTQTFQFITSNSDNAYSRTCDDEWPRTLEECSTANENFDWRVKSSSLNVLYYDSKITYKPWDIGDGTTMPAASFSSARSDPQSGSDGYNVTRGLTGFIFNVWTDTHGFSGQARPTSGTSNQSTNANGIVDWWDDYTRYTVNAGSITAENVSTLVTNANVTSTSSLSGGLNGRTLAQEKGNIANWYQYYRRRSFVTKAAISNVITEKKDFRYGLNFINNTSFTYNGSKTNFVEIPTLDHGTISHNTALIQGLYNLDWPDQNTPLRQGLERAGEYYDHNDGRTDPIIEQCQQNYSILFTDGYWNGDDPDSSIGNADSDGYSLSLADVTRYYYNKDLSGLNNNVVGSDFDPVDYQHMVTYTVAFGVVGNLIDTDGDGWPGGTPMLAEDGNWGDPTIADSPEKIDDLWHAAYNSRGRFISAKTPQELANGLKNALSNINDRRGSAASVAFNTATLSGSSAVYLAQFDNVNNKWSGDILSFPIAPITGNISSTSNWSAADVLTTRNISTNPRVILTYNDSTGLGVPFTWANLTATQKADLRKNPDNTDSGDTKAQARLTFLQGDRTNEELESGGTNGSYTFKRRSKLLGDIIHSAPLFVGKPELPWSDIAPFPSTSGANYDSFKTGAAASRQQVIYAGSNDGMLHGFKASDGSEVLSYIPSNLFSSSSATTGLHYLTDPNYAHRYYADMPIAISDAYFGSTPSWHTVLIGGGRGGSRGLFALDITDPSTFSNANAASIVLWEFDETDDPALGFTYSKPTIALMNNGRWAAIFGNGYNSTDTGEAALFIVFLDGGSSGTWTEGTDYLKITTGAGSLTSGVCGNTCNGLSTPQTVDMDGDNVIDRVYAGDLQGNMWVFDVSKKISNSTDPRTHWKVAHKSASTPVPLFTATHHETVSGVSSQSSSTRQPITSKPILAKHPSKLGGAPDVLVFFGTGQYLVDGDILNSDTQSFYGVWDNDSSLSSAITPADMVEQEFISGSFAITRNSIQVDVSSQVRVLTDNAVDYAGGNKGWFINLTLDSGERLVVDPDLYDGLVFFNTWIPNTNPCDPGGTGFLMSVKQKNGGRPDTAAFDFNYDDDGDVDSDDRVTDTATGTTYAPSGEAFDGGLASSSSFLSNNQYVSGTAIEGVRKRKVRPPSGSHLGRLSWQELRK